MTTNFPARRALANDGFRPIRVDFPRRCHLEHGDLPFWTTPTDTPADRAGQGGDR